MGRLIELDLTTQKIPHARCLTNKVNFPSSELLTRRNLNLFKLSAIFMTANTY